MSTTPGGGSNTTNMQTAMYNLRVPMPIPRTQNAPFFNGRYIEDFLNRIALHASQAGEIDLDASVKYIIDYSSDKVKDTIIHMDEFDTDKTLTWANAKKALYRLYGSTDKPKEYTEEEVKEFCREKSAKPAFTKLSEVESYYRDFIGIAASLKKRKLITDKKFDYLFIMGIPHDMKDWFHGVLPTNKRSKDDPPNVIESLDILKSRFDKNSVTYEDWRTDHSDKAKSSFNEFGNRISSAPIPQGNILNEAVGYQDPKMITDTQPVQKNSIEELTKQLEALTLLMRAKESGSPPRRDGQTGPRHCFMCGESCGQDGVHPTGPRFCPETHKLLAEHLLTFDAVRSRYVLPGGADLPRTPSGWSGGVSSYLRHLHGSAGQTTTTTAATASASARDTPPHLRSSHSVGLMYDDTDVLGGDSFALNSVPDAQHYAYPSTRSGLDTAKTKRHDPMSQVNRPEKPARQNLPSQSTLPPALRQPEPPVQQVRFAPETTRGNTHGTTAKEQHSTTDKSH
jgi:hypothetical protein